MAILCGVDIIEVDRIKQSIENLGQNFKDRIFTPGEIEYCENKKASRYQCYAARFAAKEAVAKAFGTGFGSKLDWREIEVYNDELGKPYVELQGKAKKLFEELNAVNISLSLSHCRDYAVAYAIIEVK